MKNLMLSISKTLLLCAILSCSEDEPTKTDDRERIVGEWQGDCDYNCGDILEENRMIEFNIQTSDNDDELMLDIEFRFNVNDPAAISQAENVVAVMTENGFHIPGQTVSIGTANIYISGDGIIENEELEFSLDIPLSIATCTLTGVIPKD